jgi:hypothetical protein
LKRFEFELENNVLLGMTSFSSLEVKGYRVVQREDFERERD